MEKGLPANALLEQIRSALQFEISLVGPLVPMDHVHVEHPENHGTVAEESVSRSSASTAPAARNPSESERDDVVASGSTDPFQTDAVTCDRFESLIPADSPLHGFTTLSEVQAWARSSVLIPLDEARTNLVFGVGDPDADLMVIGEAPGADEDRQGEPFVGRAGKLLTQILAAIGFKRRDVYIANILKSRPPNNRDPLPAEIEAHMPLLYKQIALIKPRVILCVGRTAGNSLLGVSASLSSLRGKFHDYHGVPVMVTYHPAALLRNPQWKRPTWEDVQQLREAYDRLTGVSVEFLPG